MSVFPLTFLILVLAAYRLTRVIVSDSLMEGWRWRMQTWAFNADKEGKPIVGDYRLAVPRFGGNRFANAVTFARGKLGDLLSCPFCMGVWISAGLVVVAWRLGIGPGGWRSVFLCAAVAGGQALCSSVDARLNKED